MNGKLYLTHTVRSLDRWRQNIADNIKRADEKWSTSKISPVIIGAPCRDKPTSVVISLNDGGRRLLVGAQVALGNDGNIVGKGGMRAQIEQVGKNIQACLAAGGAKASDIILTRAFVTDPDAFNKNADVLTLDLGPKSSGSSVATMPRLSAGPDFLVEIEAVATVKLNPWAFRRCPKQYFAESSPDWKKLRVRSELKHVTSIGYRHPRESGGPEQPFKPCGPGFPLSRE